MGNSIRHTLGHMCGGESSKEVQDVDRPIERPKESKKKSKKSKKNKKVRNDNLGSIEEENEGQNLIEPNENNVLPPVQVGDEEKYEEDLINNKSHKHEDDLTFSDKDEYETSGELSKVPLIKIDLASDTTSIDEGSEKALDEVSCIEDKEEEEEGDSTSLISSQEDSLKISIIVFSFNPMKREILGIDEADKIFETASTAYQPYIEGGTRLQDAILEFQQSVDVEKKATDCLALWLLYKGMLTEKADTTKAVDKMDMMKDIDAMKVAALALIQITEIVKPVLNNCAEDARNIDVIECTKDKILEGDEVMSTGKFSAPGKHRRNMAHLEKCTHQLTDIELETDGLLHCIQEYRDDCLKTEKLNSPSLEIRESIIFPEEKIPDEAFNDLDDLFSNFSQESSVPIVTSDCECEEVSINDRPRTPFPTANLRITPDMSVNRVSNDSLYEDNVHITVYYESDESRSSSRSSMQLSDEIIRRTVSVSLEDLVADEPTDDHIPEEEELVKTFLIRSIPETRGMGDPFSHLTSTPLRQCHTPPLMLDADPDHNTLDYGNYVFIDPSTGDIQVMRNRSRSLDSLVSMASSRSSISRFGSFEFVTDFEINIAEKNQEMMTTKSKEV